MAPSSSQENDDDNEVFLSGGGHHGGAGGYHLGAGRLPKEDSEGTNDNEGESNDDNNDQVPNNNVGEPHGYRGPRGDHGSEEPQRPIGCGVLIFINLYVKCLIVLTKK